MVPSDLLAAVDALTKPITESIKQDIYETVIGPDGRPELDADNEPIRQRAGSHTVTVTHDPPLERLAAAITSTISRQGGGGSEKHARNLLDSDALFEFMRISSTVADWCALVRIPSTRNAARDLRRWYVARLATNPESDEFYIDKLHKWERTIHAKLNTPKSWEVSDPCPRCQHSTWVDVVEINGEPTEVERNRPVLVEYWPDSTDILATAKAECRRCGADWHGSTALRALRFDIDEREHAGSENGTTTV